MAEKKNIREKFIELMYVLLYVMLMMKESEEHGENYDEKLQRIEDLKRNITIYCTNIASVLETANERSKSFENNEQFKKKFDDVIKVHDIWKSYHDRSEELAKKAIEEGGGYDENNKIKTPQDIVSVNNFVNENRIEELKKYINEISSEVKEISEDDETMLKILEELNYFGVKKNINTVEGDKKNDVEENLFKNKKLVDLLYYLYNEELNISSYMRIIFDKIMKGVDLTHPNFENFDLIVIPKKDVIVAGKNYEAEVFLNVKDYVKIEGEEPIITVNNSQIGVNNGIGIISIPTSRDIEFDEDGKCVIKLKINYSQKNPFSDKNIEIEKEVTFTVINKNEIEGQLDVNKVFYKYCSNKYVIKNTDPDPNVNITYSIEGGRIENVNVKSQSETELIIFPNSDNCKLFVLKNGVVSTEFDFATMDIPDPTYDFFVGDSILYPDKLNTVKDIDLDDVTIDVICNELFSKSYPLDSKFAVKDWVIEITDNKGNQLLSKSVKDLNSVIFDDNEKNIIKSNNCKFINIKVNNIIRYHKQNENVTPEEIPLFKPGEFLTRKIEVIHKKNTKKGGRKR